MVVYVNFLTQLIMKKKLFLTIQLTDTFILIVALLFESKRRYYLGIWKLEHIDKVSKKAYSYARASNLFEEFRAFRINSFEK